MIGSIALAQIGAPAESVGLPTPHRKPIQLARRPIHPVIEHRVLQVLECQTIVAPVAPTERGRAGLSATRAAPPDANAARIEPQFGRVVEDVVKPAIAIVDRCRVWRFWRE